MRRFNKVQYRKLIPIDPPEWKLLHESSDYSCPEELYSKIGLRLPNEYNDNSVPVEIAKQYGLYHELCDYMISNNIGKSNEECSIRYSKELLAFNLYSKELCILTTPSEVAAIIIQIANTLDTNNYLRTESISIFSGSINAEIAMPNAKDAVRRFEEICSLIAIQNRHSMNYQFEFCIWIMIMLTNAHPFNDGNGRISRVLFNALLNKCIRPNCSYLDISELMRVARGGFEIRVREAEIFERWEPICQFIYNGMNFVFKENIYANS